MGWQIVRRSNESVAWEHVSDPCLPGHRMEIVAEQDRHGRVCISANCVDFSTAAGSARVRRELASGLTTGSGIVNVFSALHPCIGDGGDCVTVSERRSEQFPLWQGLSDDPGIRDVHLRCERVCGVLRTANKKVGAVILLRDGKKHIHAATCSWFCAGPSAACEASCPGLARAQNTH